MEENAISSFLESRNAPAWVMVAIFLGHILWQSFLSNKAAISEQRKRLDEITQKMATKEDINNLTKRIDKALELRLPQK